MGRVTITEIQKGDALTVVPLNTTLLSWLTESNDIDGENVADGGLDEINFADEAATEAASSPQIAASSSSSTISRGTAPTGTTTPIQVGSADMATGPYTFDSTDGQRLLVMCSFQYRGTVPASPGDAVWTAQLGYSTDWNGTTGNWTFLDQTLRRLEGGYASIDMVGSMTIAHGFIGPLISSSLYFGLFVWDAAGGGTDDIEIGDINFFAVNLKR